MLYLMIWMLMMGKHLDVTMVPAEGIEPTLCCQNRILSPTRLPVPPRRRSHLSGAASIGMLLALANCFFPTEQIAAWFILPGDGRACDPFESGRHA